MKWQWDFETFSFGVTGFLFGLRANFSFIIQGIVSCGLFYRLLHRWGPFCSNLMLSFLFTYYKIIVKEVFVSDCPLSNARLWSSYWVWTSITLLWVWYFPSFSNKYLSCWKNKVLVSGFGHSSSMLLLK